MWQAPALCSLSVATAVMRACVLTSNLYGRAKCQGRGSGGRVLVVEDMQRHMQVGACWTAVGVPCAAQDVRQTLYDELLKLNPDKDWSFITRQIGARHCGLGRFRRALY